MKKIIIIILLLSQQVISFAQTSQGRVIVGPSVVYQNQILNNYDVQGNPNGNKNIYNNLTITLQPGYFISDNFCLGVSAVYTDNTQDAQSFPLLETNSYSKTWQYGLFARSYCKIADNFYLTNSFVMTLQTGTNNVVTNYITQDSSTTSSLGVKGYLFSYAVGFSYFIKPWISIKTNIGSISYNHVTTTITSGLYSGTSTTNGLFTFTSPLNAFNIGIDFFFGKAGGGNTSETK